MDLRITALENGVVIDHIPPERTFALVKLLKLKNYENVVTVAVNLQSSLLGKKGLIKIADKTLSASEMSIISLLAPNATVNIIKDAKVAEKIPLALPDETDGLLYCENLKCISNAEKIPSRFIKVLSHGKNCYKCFYCERVVKAGSVKLNLH